MPKRAIFSLKQLTAAGFVEVAPGRFEPGKGNDHLIAEKPKSFKSKRIKLQKTYPFIQLCTTELKITPVAEYRFAPPRRWRMDYAFIEQKVFVEVEGGIWTGGRHTRGKGFKADMEKYNEAATLGWRMLRTVPTELLSNKLIDQLKNMLSNKFL